MATIIKKLPPTWKQFKNYLKHKLKEMKLEDLIVRLRIEKDNHIVEKKVKTQYVVSKANAAEQATNSQWKTRKYMNQKVLFQ